MKISSSSPLYYKNPDHPDRLHAGLARGVKDAFVGGCSAAAVGGVVTNLAKAATIQGASPFTADSPLFAAYGAVPSAVAGAVVGGLVGGVLGALKDDPDSDWQTGAALGTAAGILCGTSAGLFLGTLGHPATYVLHAFGC